MFKKMGNIGNLISVDLIELIKNDSKLQLSDHPFKKWENVKQYLHGYDKVSQYSAELHEIHSIYSTHEFEVDLDEFEKAHLKRHEFYPATVKFDMALTDKVQPILEYFKMEYAIIKTTYQPPGEIYPVHYDQMHSSKSIFESISSAIDVSQDIILRFTIFLEDWIQGQFLFADDFVLQWKKGDTYCWDNQVLHGSANVGLFPKLCLTITGPYNYVSNVATS
jgi:hypothetical protein